VRFAEWFWPNFKVKNVAKHTLATNFKKSSRLLTTCDQATSVGESAPLKESDDDGSLAVVLGISPSVFLVV